MIIMSLINVIKNNKNSRKIFGRKEIEIILRQMNGISLTQSEKNRLSRDIRAKLQFIKEISAFHDEFELKKNSGNIKIIAKAVELILQDSLKNKIKAILLVGSHARGIVTKRSDLDICVIFNDISLEDATRFRIRVSGELPSAVDIQVFNVMPQKIKKTIAANHKVLYREKNFDDISYSIKYLKDDDYRIRMDKIMGVKV